MKPDEIKSILKSIGSCVNFEALEYINELESDLRLLKNDYDILKSVADETVERNQRLREKLMRTTSDLKKAKSDAIKEFAEKIKASKDTLFNNIYSGFHFNVIIDSIAKEMVGEDK